MTKNINKAITAQQFRLGSAVLSLYTHTVLYHQCLSFRAVHNPPGGHLGFTAETGRTSGP